VHAMTAFTVNPRDPEVSETLARWIALRDRREALAQQALDKEITYREYSEAAAEINCDLTDVADELVSFLVPTAAARALHLSLNSKHETALAG
ncbi:hypothetical protein, partial [Mycolicibacterium sp.]|uniref:hypothetical protein n=1 Tax=Mycolicibacterium sp. TaxID=2320850 RepID=UPI0035604F78